MKTLTVSIGRLVVEGLPLDRREGRQLKAAVERELTRLLAGGGLTGEIVVPRTLASLAGPSIDVGPDVKAGAVGEQIARSVHAGLGAKP